MTSVGVDVVKFTLISVPPSRSTGNSICTDSVWNFMFTFLLLCLIKHYYSFSSSNEIFRLIFILCLLPGSSYLFLSSFHNRITPFHRSSGLLVAFITCTISFLFLFQLRHPKLRSDPCSVRNSAPTSKDQSFEWTKTTRQTSSRSSNTKGTPWRTSSCSTTIVWRIWIPAPSITEAAKNFVCTVAMGPLPAPVLTEKSPPMAALAKVGCRVPFSRHLWPISGFQVMMTREVSCVWGWTFLWMKICIVGRRGYVIGWYGRSFKILQAIDLDI